MRISTSKSKNSESFYITQSYTNAEGKSTSKTIRKLGTLAELSEQLHTDRDGVVEWANEQARLETLKYKSEKEDATVMIPFHSNRLLDYNKQNFSTGHNKNTILNYFPLPANIYTILSHAHQTDG